MSRLASRYTRPGDPLAFSGIGGVSRYMPELSRRQVLDQLATIDTYTRHREAKRPRVYNPYFIYGKRFMFQADLMDVSGLREWNDNVRYLLFVIDCFTRKLWIEPLREKNADAVLRAFEVILRSSSPPPPRRLVTDRGKEFTNAKFQRFLRARGIRHILPSSKAPHVERAQRTIQNLLYKYLTHKETRVFLPTLPLLLRSYNGRFHRSIGMAPNEAELKENAAAVNDNLAPLYQRARKAKRPPRFRPGEPVRIQLEKNKFAKGHEDAFSVEVFRIGDINGTLPIPTYRLTDYSGAELEGSFYESELQPFRREEGSPGRVFKVERTLGKRRGKGGTAEYLVKWLGYPPRFNSWVTEDDLQDLP